jgi:hypothetical protein
MESESTTHFVPEFRSLGYIALCPQTPRNGWLSYSNTRELLAVFIFGGSGPALTACGSLDLKQEFQNQIKTPENQVSVTGQIQIDGRRVSSQRPLGYQRLRCHQP